MKKLFQGKKIQITAAILIYLLMMAVGIIAIIFYPLSRQKNFYILHAEEIAENYLSGGEELPIWSDGLTRCVIFDNVGNYIEDVASSASLKNLIDLTQLTDSVLEGESVFKLMVPDKTHPASYGIVGIAGVPVIKDGSIIGAAFYIRKLIAIWESSISFAAVFTLIYWIAVSFFFKNLKRKKLIELEKERYVANVTHSLKTPISTVRMLSEALCDGVITDPNKQQVYYGLILKETNRQSKMVQEMLNLSKLQNRSVEIKKNVIGARELFEPILENYIKMFDLMDIKLKISKELCNLPELYTDASRIKEIMQVLLDNELNNVPRHGCVCMEALCSTKHAIISLKDNGIGIAPEDLPHLFERFYKGSNTNSNESSGLGLAIAYENCKCLGEKITAGNNPDGGAVFSFTIQLK